jgi:ribonuclease HII
MPSGMYIPGVNDSKKLSPAKREQLYDHILSSCVEYGIGIVDHDTIDAINILQATFRAFQTAFNKLHTPINLLLVDGSLRIPNIIVSQRCVCHGDALSYRIACASILAKVTRDRLMIDLDTQYQGWGFAQHKGYGTSDHLQALTRLGLSPIHRKSFKPMSDLLKKEMGLHA